MLAENCTDKSSCIAFEEGEMKSKKRAPRLPGHLARSEASFTSCKRGDTGVYAYTDTMSERPTSRCSNFDADSVYSEGLGACDVMHKEQWCRHDSSPQPGLCVPDLPC